jgi:magnesium chelatase family protein
MLATVPTLTRNGTPATVEAHVAPGLPGFDVIGLPGGAVRELRDRLRAAAINGGHDWPARRITVNVVPRSADLWPGMDAAILEAVMEAAGTPNRAPVVGSLGLDGSLIPVALSAR